MKKLLLAVALAGAMSSSAMAAPYAEIDLGGSLPMDQDFKNSLSPDAQISYKDAFALTAAAGYNFNNGFRAELEYGYQNPDFDKVTGHISGVPVEFTGSGAGADVHTFMTNGYYDIGTKTAFTPFVGAGLGFAYIKANAGTPPAGATAYMTSDDSATVFAYQATLGASYALTDHVSLTGSYRYLGTSEGSFKTTLTVAGVGSTSGDVKTSYSSNVLRAGLRYTF